MDKAINLEQIEQLISNKTRESHQLEYKAAAALKDSKEITRDVSSFANASGGVILYGVTEIEDKNDGAIPDQIDPMPLQAYKLESLEQVINTIEPRIPNFRIDPIKISDGNFIYAVRIPQGETAHQALDQKYYRRHNFQRLAMHDQEIRDVMNRLKNPDVTLSFEIKDRRIYSTIFNSGPILANHVKCIYEIPRMFLLELNGFVVVKEGFKYLRFESLHNAIHPSSETIVSNGHIIGNDLSDILYFQYREPKETPKIFWKVWADSAKLKEGSLDIRDIKNFDIHSL